MSVFTAGVPALVLSMLLVGCGAASASSVPTTSSSTVVPTMTPRPLPAETTAPLASGAVAGCQLSGRTSTQFVAVGPLKFAGPTRALDYPSALIPSNAPSAPYQIPASETTGSYNPNPPVNPTLNYVVTMCNTTSATHTISGVTVSIAGFSPSSGTINEWNLCEGPYDTSSKNAMGGCGGGIGGPGFGYYSATLPSDTVGAMATVHPTNGSSSLPFSLQPNTSLSLVIALAGVSSQGTYSLTFGVSIDGAASTALGPSDGSFLIAPAAVKWTGLNCETPAMQAEIPASSQATYYVCPPSS